MKKKLVFFLSGTGILLVVLGIIIIIPCLLILDFFGSNITDDYVENNIEYADEYKAVLNTNITKNNNGYIPLNRILYFYQRDETKSFEEIYTENLDKDLKKMKPISDVCLKQNYFGCNSIEIKQSNQLDEYQNKPFSAPLDFSKSTITSFFMQERIVYDKYDVHKAWDFASNAEEIVYSVCDGIVKKVSFPYKENKIDTTGGYGNHIVIECNVDDTKFLVTYGHLYPNSSKIKLGDSVTKKQEIATVGTTGYSTGNHLHFQVQKSDNSYIDGMSLINFLDDDDKVSDKKDDYLLPPNLKKNN